MQYIKILDVPDFSKMECIKLNKRNSLNSHSGVYLLFNGNELIYIGRSTAIGRRVQWHLSSFGAEKIFDTVFYLKTNNIAEQKILEAIYIEMFQPKYNNEWFEFYPLGGTFVEDKKPNNNRTYVF